MGESVKQLSDFKVKIFADGADKAQMLELYANPVIEGFTTNPTLMRKAGVADYQTFALEVLELIPDRPISFEVFADEFDEMEGQALEISSWGQNVYTKIPVTNCRREPSDDLLTRLSGAGVKVNATALMTVSQVERVAECMAESPAGYVSLFAGRIADTGRDPTKDVADSVEILRAYPQLELVWASPREVLNIVQANETGCHIITATTDILAKLPLLGKDLDEFSLETVRMFYDDAQAAAYRLETTREAAASH